jgi:hypothetical protein
MRKVKHVKVDVRHVQGNLAQSGLKLWCQCDRLHDGDDAVIGLTAPRRKGSGVESPHIQAHDSQQKS